MSDILAAHDLVPYKNIITAHEAKFSNFLVFMGRPELAKSSQLDRSAYAIQVGDYLYNVLSYVLITAMREQLVSQVDRGAVLSKQYFISAALCSEAESAGFKEVNESEITALGLEKSGSFKNFKSRSEKRFYEINMYERNARDTRPVNVSTERPEGIDL